MKLVSLLLTALLPSLAVAYTCPHGKDQHRALSPEDALPWTENESLRNSVQARPGVKPNKHQVNLDLAPEERWVEIGKIYANRSTEIIDYFEDMLPHAAVVAISKIAAHLVDYKGFGDFSGEMKGYSEGLGLDLGYVVAANLVYQLESIGVNCSNWNNTGPTGQCEGEDPVDEVTWYESPHYLKNLNDEIQTGFCTSVVTNTADGNILHGRNLDWNLEESLREFVIDVDFMRGGEVLYTGSTIVSFVGVLNAMKAGPDGFSFSMDARCQGGKLWANLLEALAFGAMEPCQHSRYVMETATNFEEAVHLFETGHIIDDGYFIVGGAETNQGAVVSRARNHNVDTWRIDPDDAEHGWYRLETNYDHDDPVPSSDDRRTPGFANMEKVGLANINEDNLMSDVMTQWPTFNPHTDLTCIMRPATGLYDCTVWMDDVE